MSRATLLLAALLAACGDAKVPTGVTPPGVVPAIVATHLRLWIDNEPPVVGLPRKITVAAMNSGGIAAPVDGVVLEFADSTAATVDSTWRGITSPAGPAYALYATIRPVRAGTVWLRAHLRALVDSIAITTMNPPDLRTQLTVDSFYVAEYPVKCAFPCAYVAYSPVLWLRNHSPFVPVTVLEVEFLVGDKTTGRCEGARQYLPGESSVLVGIDPYVYSNDLIFVTTGGWRLPADSGTMRLRVKGAGDDVTWMQVRGPVVHRNSVDELPYPGVRNPGWNCPYP